MNEQAIDKERGGLPGCSELHRIMACPGYLHAKSTWPKPKELPAKPGASDAKSDGSKMHEALEVMEYIIDGQSIEMTLTAAQQWVVEQSASVVQRITAEVFAGEKPGTMMVEQRMTMKDKGEALLSGKADKMVANSKWDWIIFDYKTGGKPVPQATDNWQVHGLGLCLESWIGEQPNIQLGGAIYGAIVQPLVSLFPTVVKITPEAARAVKRQIVDAIRRAKVTGQPRIPGEHCTYCPVAGQCFEAQSTGVIVQKRFTSLASLSPAQLFELYKLVPEIEKRCEEVRQHVKRMLFEQEGSIPGLELVEQGGGHEVEDKISFLKAIMPTVTKEEFTNSLNTPVAKLRDLWVERAAEKQQCTKAVALKMWNDQVGPTLVPKPKRLIVREAKDGKPKELQAQS